LKKEETMTERTIKKIAREAGISISLVSAGQYRGETSIRMVELPPDVMKRLLDYCRENGYKRNTLEVQRLIRKYNQQVNKLIAVFKTRGLSNGFWGRQLGDGRWEYTDRWYSHTDELVANNMD
jgi:DNA-binding LacI/PurR family transcriptional regulator